MDRMMTDATTLKMFPSRTSLLEVLIAPLGLLLVVVLLTFGAEACGTNNYNFKHPHILTSER